MVAQLDALGILDRRWSLAHTVWVDGDDIDLLARRKAVVVHNPHSNSKIGAGIAPVARMLAEGVPVALGTDGGEHQRHALDPRGDEPRVAACRA